MTSETSEPGLKPERPRRAPSACTTRVVRPRSETTCSPSGWSRPAFLYGHVEAVVHDQAALIADAADIGRPRRPCPRPTKRLRCPQRAPDWRVAVEVASAGE